MRIGTSSSTFAATVLYLIELVIKFTCGSIFRQGICEFKEHYNKWIGSVPILWKKSIAYFFPRSFLKYCGCFISQILSVSAIVLANLCVSYIMTSANEEVSPLSILLCWVLDKTPYSSRASAQDIILVKSFCRALKLKPFLKRLLCFVLS